MRTWLWGGAYLAIAVLNGACGDPACEAGRQIACPCPGGTDGVQVCADDGSAFGECQCGGTGGESVGAGGPGGGSSVGGGGAGGGMVACAPAAVEDCYDGPAGTAGVGVCHAGTRICDATGMWGLCMGQVQPGAEDCQTPDDEDCDGATPACAAPFALTFDGPSSVVGIAPGPGGEIYLTGQFDDTIDFGNGAALSDAGASDMFLAKLNADGSGVWALQAGGPINTCQPALHGLATDSSGNVWVAVDCILNVDVFGTPVQSQGEMDVVLVKLDPAGNILSFQSFGSAGYDRTMGLAIDSNDRVVLTVFHAQPIYFGGQDVHPGPGVAIVTLDTNGDWVWSRDLAQLTGNEAPVTIDPITDGPVVTFPFSGTVDLGDGPLNSTQSSLLVARFAPDGTLLKSHATGGAAGVSLVAGGVISNGDLMAMGGWFNGNLDLGDGPITPLGGDFFVARFDASGQLVGKTVFKGTMTNVYLGWVATDDHALFFGVGGPFDFGGGTITNTNFVVELDSSFGFVDQITFGTPTALSVGAYAIANDGVPLYGGTSYGGPWDFNGQMIAASPSGSGFLVRSP